MPCACEIANKVGMLKPDKDATQVYDKAYGTYSHSHDHGSTKPLPNEPKPFRLGGEQKK